MRWTSSGFILIPMSNATYITVTDMTSNRCTVTGVYTSWAKAEAAVENDDQAWALEVHDGPEPKVGDRAYHAKGVAWVKE